MQEPSKSRWFSIGFWTIGLNFWETIDQGFVYTDAGGLVLCFEKEGIAQHQLRITEINKWSICFFNDIYGFQKPDVKNSYKLEKFPEIFFSLSSQKYRRRLQICISYLVYITRFGETLLGMIVISVASQNS
jgi:hypothetical protein